MKDKWLHIRIAAPLRKALQSAAEQRGVSISDLVRQIIESALANHIQETEKNGHNNVGGA